MKRLSLFGLLLLVCAGMSAASYGILVNGNYYFAGTKNESPMDPSFEEWQALGVPVEAGDELQLYDRENNAAWAVTLDTWSVAGFSLAGDHYTCTVSGCYDFYIKLKWQEDQLYVGPHEGDCSGNKGEYVGEGPEPTGLHEADASEPKAQKRIENNMLLIQCGEAVYTVGGQSVR